MAGEMRATPQNPALGMLSGGLSSIDQFLSKPFGYNNPVGSIVSGLFGIPALQQVTERMSYGEPLTTGSGMTTRPRPETMEAAMSVAPALPAAGRLAARAVRATEGLPVGMGIKDVGDDIFSLSKQEFLGKPRITNNANAADLKPIELTTLKDVEPQPFMGGKYQIKMNEDGAVVLDKGKPIASYNFGDTLVVDKPYRKSGLAQELVYEWRTTFPAPAVATERTKASQAIQEKVWERIQDEKQSLPQQIYAPQQAALDLAQQRAALPIEQGGLGLPTTNTAADRAKAMGFDMGTYHGTDAPNIESLDPKRTKIIEGVFSAFHPKTASMYAEDAAQKGRAGIESAPNVMPLLLNSQSHFQMPAFNKQMIDSFRNSGYAGVQRPESGVAVTFDPAQIRSRFAAFDPFRKDVATATAMGVALPDLLAQPVQQYPTPYETTPMYTDPFGNTIGESIR